MGLSLRNCALKIIDTKTGKQVYSDFGEMLFTHFGVSGPMILSASAHMRNMEPCRYEIYVDMKPALDDKSSMLAFYVRCRKTAIRLFRISWGFCYREP